MAPSSFGQNGREVRLAKIEIVRLPKPATTGQCHGPAASRSLTHP
jgi:hypothetical protein